jgi:DNA-directed RNA polymerase specialized sigma24 family protein
MVERRRLPVPILPDERELILKLAAEGVAYRAIAERLNRPQGTINRAISDGILTGRITRRNERFDSRKD